MPIYCPSLFSLLVQCWNDNPEVQGSIPGGCSDFLVFEVSISNRPIYRADQGSAIENPNKRLFHIYRFMQFDIAGYELRNLFWPPEGCKVRQYMAQNLQTAISQSLQAGSCSFEFVWCVCLLLCCDNYTYSNVLLCSSHNFIGSPESSKLNTLSLRV